MEIIEANFEKMETQLKQWGTTLEELFAKAEKSGSKVKADYRKRLDELKSKYQTTKSKLDEFKAAGLKKRDTFKNGVGSVWYELEVAFKKLTN